MTDSTPADDPNTNGAASVQALVQAEDAVKETKADPPADIVSEDKAAAEESTAATAPEETAPENGDTEKAAEEPATTTPIVSQNKKSRPPYKYDPNKVTLRFLFANRDGLTVTLECNPSDTVSEVKGALLSVWPEDLPGCSGGDRLRLICMGKGLLMPDSRTLEDCQVPVFKTHPTPINVSVRPEFIETGGTSKGGSDPKGGRGGSNAGGSSSDRAPASGLSGIDQGCACIIL